MGLYAMRGHSCLECGDPIDPNVYDYSCEHFHAALCRPCQDWLRNKQHETTPETIELYFALLKRGVPAELEKFDGHKTIDIAVTVAKVNIEVDGGHHNYDHRQALADLQRTYYAFKKGYLTLRIPNSLVTNSLDDTAKYITEFLNVGVRKSNPSRRSSRRSA